MFCAAKCFVLRIILRFTVNTVIRIHAMQEHIAFEIACYCDEILAMYGLGFISYGSTRQRTGRPRTPAMPPVLCDRESSRLKANYGAQDAVDELKMPADVRRRW